MPSHGLPGSPPDALRECLETPLPPPETPLSEVALLAMDFETTGLAPERHSILSIGFVPVDGRVISLAGASRFHVAGAAVGESATIHGLTDDVVADGLPLAEAVDRVLVALSGRVLLAHYAAIERTFLRSACRRLWGVDLALPTIDTMELQRRLLAARWGADPEPGALRLWSARRRHGLPVYPAHDALVDALACAELYLAQSAELGYAASAPLTLKALGEDL